MPVSSIIILTNQDFINLTDIVIYPYYVNFKEFATIFKIIY